MPVERIAGTVGYALPGEEVRVRDGDLDAAPGEPGVLEARQRITSRMRAAQRA